LTNPPFVFARDLADDARPVADEFELARDGQWDLCWLFAERALTHWLRRDGTARLGLVLPEAVLARDEPARLRRFLVARVRELDVCPIGRAFAGAATGIVALTATAATAGPGEPGTITVQGPDGALWRGPLPALRET